MDEHGVGGLDLQRLSPVKITVVSGEIVVSMPILTEALGYHRRVSPDSHSAFESNPS
jgi:hypothetical protein